MRRSLGADGQAISIGASSATSLRAGMDDVIFLALAAALFVALGAYGSALRKL